MTYYLAVDIGASSGRHILGCVENGTIKLEEIYRFDNGIQPCGGALVWDIGHLLREVKAGIAKCKELGKLPKTVAIDTWGVDYVLLDEAENEILPAVAYRDSRTAAALKKVHALVSPEKLYARTGIQQQNFNTIYQLFCDKESGKLYCAAHFLMMPEYLSYKLTGVMKNEYTNASTTGLVNAESKQWDAELLCSLGIPETLFLPLSKPGTPVGTFSEDVVREVGFNAEVLLAPSHDTASAVAACPLDDDSVYLSSGTWSLIGTENLQPVLSEGARNANFTNEGGVEYRFRFLKNIMGMWLFQNIRKELGKRYTYDEMMQLAMESDYKKTFDCNDPTLTAPESMIGAIKALLGEELPLGDVLSSVYHSLANSYRIAVEEIEALSGKQIEKLLIVGGGSKDRYLNALTAKTTGKRVLTGLSEATALGSLLSQLMHDQNLDLAAARNLVKQSFDIKETII